MTHPPRTAARLPQSLSINEPEGIDLEAIAWLSGANVKYRELDDCDACIAGRADVGRAIISIDNPKDRLDEQSGAYDILFGGGQDDRFMSTVEGDTWFDVEWTE